MAITQTQKRKLMREYDFAPIFWSHRGKHLRA